MNAVMAALKMMAFILWSALCVPSQLLVLLFNKNRLSYVLPYVWHKGVRRIFGLSINRHGQMVTKGQVLYLCNHLSYLDIPVLGSIIPHASFVAKSEVANWPVFGFLARLQQTAFISRARHASKNSGQTLEELLDAGKNLIVFPEGTSTDGSQVLPFKSALFATLVQEKYSHLILQPISLKVEHLSVKNNGATIPYDLYAWPRESDMPLPDHLWRFAKTGGARIRLVFHAPVAVKAFDDRKALAKTCHEAVCKGVECGKPVEAAGILPETTMKTAPIRA